MLSQKLINHMIRRCQEQGFLNLMTRVFFGIKEILIGQWVIMYVLLTDPIPNIDPAIPIVLRKACKTDLHELRTIGKQYGHWHYYHFIEWFTRQDTFFVALFNKRIIGYSSAGLRDRMTGGLGKFGEDDAVGLATFVIPQYRGKRVGPSLSAAVSRHLREQGYKRKVTLVDFHNSNSRKALTRAGHVECAVKSVSQVYRNRIIQSLKGRIFS